MSDHAPPPSFFWARLNAWGGFDRLRVLPLLTVVLLLIHAPDVWYLRTPLIFLCILGVAFEQVLRRPAFWYVIATLLGTTVYLNWESSDNHKYLFVYWALTMCAVTSLPREQQGSSLAISSRWLLALCMLLATVWKAVNPQYMDGGFFEYELLTDRRFESFASLVTGMPAVELHTNQELWGLLHHGHLRGLKVDGVQLSTHDGIRPLALFLTLWTVLIEGILAVLYFLPNTRRVAVIRNTLLIVFAATTYSVANVRGFGWMLMLLGMAQSEDRDRDFRLAFLGGFLLIQAYTFPVSAISGVLLGN